MDELIQKIIREVSGGNITSVKIKSKSVVVRGTELDMASIEPEIVEYEYIFPIDRKMYKSLKENEEFFLSQLMPK